VEVTERQTASFLVGAGVNSVGGVTGNLTYEQKNFDITSPPEELGDVFSDRAYTGAGQRFKATLSPGTEFNDASILFGEPYIFDQDYSFTGELYYRDRGRTDYQETRIGGRTTFGKRLDYENSVGLTLKAEGVEIHELNDAPLRAPEIRELEGTTPMTSIALQYRRDTTNRGIIPYRGSTLTLGTEQAVPPGDYSYNKVDGRLEIYKALDEDLLERKTVVSLSGYSGYIFGDSPFFDNFYGGGLGSVRGFRYRGISPRSGLDDDAVGGQFVFVGSAEVSFPLAGDYLRYVLFTDVGDVEQDLTIGTIRSSVGFGFRMTLPFFGDAPLALDFAVPISKNGQDETQLVSFSLGFSR
jgi:outer membrane protein insertion porin family